MAYAAHVVVAHDLDKPGSKNAAHLQHLLAEKVALLLVKDSLAKLAAAAGFLLHRRVTTVGEKLRTRTPSSQHARRGVDHVARDVDAETRTALLQKMRRGKLLLVAPRTARTLRAVDIAVGVKAHVVQIHLAPVAMVVLDRRHEIRQLVVRVFLEPPLDVAVYVGAVGHQFPCSAPGYQPPEAAP